MTRDARTTPSASRSTICLTEQGSRCKYNAGGSQRTRRDAWSVYLQCGWGFQYAALGHSLRSVTALLLTAPPSHRSADLQVPRGRCGSIICYGHGGCTSGSVSRLACPSIQAYDVLQCFSSAICTAACTSPGFRGRRGRTQCCLNDGERTGNGQLSHGLADGSPVLLTEQSTVQSVQSPP